MFQPKGARRRSRVLKMVKWSTNFYFAQNKNQRRSGTPRVIHTQCMANLTGLFPQYLATSSNDILGNLGWPAVPNPEHIGEPRLNAVIGRHTGTCDKLIEVLHRVLPSSAEPAGVGTTTY